jgi:hypothetical protein
LIGGMVGGLYCDVGVEEGLPNGGVCGFVGDVAGGLDCEGNGDCVGGVACGVAWFVGGVEGGMYCEGGRDCGRGVAKGLATGGDNWLVEGVTGELY